MEQRRALLLSVLLLICSAHSRAHSKTSVIHQIPTLTQAPIGRKRAIGHCRRRDGTFRVRNPVGSCFRFTANGSPISPAGTQVHSCRVHCALLCGRSRLRVNFTPPLDERWRSAPVPSSRPEAVCHRRLRLVFETRSGQGVQSHGAPTRARTSTSFDQSQRRASGTRTTDRRQQCCRVGCAKTGPRRSVRRSRIAGVK